MRMVKGSHFIVPRLYESEEAYILQNKDGRIVFVIPYEDDFSLVGTTDENYTGDPSAASISDAETKYLIDVVNTAELDELQIFSISSDNAQFHPAMFKPQVLPPQGRATIQIIYLPRVVGDVEGTLTISTSAGDVLYAIRAQAVANPYRLHPFVGTKIPAGVVYSRPIIMYNPTDELLHVREVFTTESFLHLHLPDSDADNSFGFEASLSSPTSSEGMWQGRANRGDGAPP